MKNLILSYGIYDWLPYCSGIGQEVKNSRTELMILCSERFNSAQKYPELCPEAIDAQRVFELKKISNLLNINKITRMEEDCSDINFQKIVIQIELMTLFGGIDNIYYPDCGDVIKELKRFFKIGDVNFYAYGSKYNKSRCNKIIELNEKMYENKQNSFYFTKGAKKDMCKNAIYRTEFFF